MTLKELKQITVSLECVIDTFILNSKGIKNNVMAFDMCKLQPLT